MAQDRRAETARPDRLFSDPLAAAFVDAALPATADTPLSWLNDGLTLKGFCPAMGDYVALRTRYFDDQALRAVSDVRQVVMPAAGFDARRFGCRGPRTFGCSRSTRRI